MPSNTTERADRVGLIIRKLAGFNDLPTLQTITTDDKDYEYFVKNKFGAQLEEMNNIIAKINDNETTIENLNKDSGEIVGLQEELQKRLEAGIDKETAKAIKLRLKEFDAKLKELAIQIKHRQDQIVGEKVALRKADESLSDAIYKEMKVRNASDYPSHLSVIRLHGYIKKELQDAGVELNHQLFFKDHNTRDQLKSLKSTIDELSKEYQSNNVVQAICKKFNACHKALDAQFQIELEKNDKEIKAVKSELLKSANNLGTKEKDLKKLIGLLNKRKELMKDDLGTINVLIFQTQTLYDGFFPNKKNQGVTSTQNNSVALHENLHKEALAKLEFNPLVYQNKIKETQRQCGEISTKFLIDLTKQLRGGPVNGFMRFFGKKDTPAPASNDNSFDGDKPHKK